MLKNMKIGRKLALGFGLVLTLMGVVAAAGYWGLQTAAEMARDILTVRSPLVEHSQRARANTLGLRRFEKDYFINIGSPDKQLDYLAKWTDQKERLVERLDVLDKLAQTDADRETLRRSARTWRSTSRASGPSSPASRRARSRPPRTPTRRSARSRTRSARSRRPPTSSPTSTRRRCRSSSRSWPRTCAARCSRWSWWCSPRSA